MQTNKQFTIILLAGAFAFGQAHLENLHADEVTDWNEHLLQAAHAAGTSPLITTRIAAIVQTAVFDAAQPIHGPAGNRVIDG